MRHCRTSRSRSSTCSGPRRRTSATSPSSSRAVGAWGGGRPNAADLADLFALELDKLRNQYETVQRGAREAQADQVDEVLERLQELARRQQQVAERAPRVCWPAMRR